MGSGRQQDTEMGSGGQQDTEMGSGGQQETQMGSGGREETHMGSGGRQETEVGSGGRQETEVGSGGRQETEVGSGGRQDTEMGPCEQQEAPWKIASFYQPGDVLIGGLFVIHSGYDFPELTFQDVPQPPSCKGFHVRYYRDVLGLMFAIDEINKSRELLPNITLGFSLFDSCMSELRAIWGALSLVSGTGSPVPRYNCHKSSDMIGLIGETMSALSLPIARVLGVLHYPQISHSASSSSLSDKVNFPSFLRTVSTNMFQNIALSKIINVFGWTWVGMLVVDNDVGEQGGQAIRNELEKSGSCVAFIEKIHLSYSMRQIQRVVAVIKESSVSVIVLHSPEAHVKALLDTMYNEKVIGKIFISSASFTMTPGLFSKKAWRVLNGTIGLMPSTGSMSGFQEFLQHLQPSGDTKYPFIQMFWEISFNCTWPIGKNDTVPGMAMSCSGKEDVKELIHSLFEINDLSYTYHAYLAVYAYAHTLHVLLTCQSEGGYHVCTNVSSIRPWKVLQYLKKTKFRAKDGPWVNFDSNGDLSSSYDIMTIQVLDGNFQLVKVGTFNPRTSQDNWVILNTSSIIWNENFSNVPRSVCSDSCQPGYRRLIRRGQPVCCFNCVSCSAGEISNTTDAAECMRCPTDQWSNEERDQCVPKVVEFLSYQEPLGYILVSNIIIFSIITFSILLLFIRYKETPIVKATNRELSYVLLVSLMFCFLCCLLFIGRPSTFSCLLRQICFSIVFSISISSVLAKTIMVILAFKATNPNSPLRKWLGPKIPRNVVGLCSVMQSGICSAWLLVSPPFPRMNTESVSHKVIFECDEGQNIFFYMAMGFMGLLAMVSFVVAFLARNLPGNFNEAKLITFSMLVFSSVWVSFIPAYLSTRGKYTVAVQIFAILASSAGLLSCIFIPKCYILLARPERSHREYLSSHKRFGIEKL
ncbi:vomeronasal type-2 receptor 1-like [Spea bombifrons]|uniref:vomeronasal type-2 receptor 1-like n=1 Tax=Spea bombifrons TaxID=233779 RepID=UPI00234B3334|nr:vomeronasal type-2 receptor 1-like [Spea bombifrons]